MLKNLPQAVIAILSQNSDIKSLDKRQMELLQRSSPINFPGGLKLATDRNDSEYHCKADLIKIYTCFIASGSEYIFTSDATSNDTCNKYTK